MDDLLLGGSRIGLEAAERRDEDSDFFEWNLEGAQEQILAAVGRDAASGREAGERGEEKEPVVDLPPAAPSLPSSPSKRFSEILSLRSTNPKFVTPSIPTESGRTKSRMRSRAAASRLGVTFR